MSENKDEKSGKVEMDLETAAEKKCLLLFSGGRDSFLAACVLIEHGYKVHLVTFDNGATLRSSNVKLSVDRLKGAYGDRVDFLGIKSIVGIWREFFLPYMNMKPSEIIQEWGELPISQLNCLTCRSAMYIWAVIKCKQAGIPYIAEGVREDDAFAVQQRGILERFRRLLNQYSIELLLPVYNVKSDWERKNKLLMRNFVPKTLEPQCLVGVPLPPEGLPQEVYLAAEVFFDKYILPRAQRIIEEQSNIVEISKKGELM
jgi:hypothetical protein